MSIKKEFQITWRTIQNDYNTTLIPITTYFLFSASQTSDFSLLGTLLTSICYATAYIVPFCLSNQLNGIAEDKLEKPYRPLSAGLITPLGALARYLIWNIVLLLISIYLGITKWSALWMIVTLYHNFLNGDKHFLTKNVISMTLGTAAQFGAAWNSYHLTMSASKQFWMWMVAIWIGVLANIQDFRDMKGDAKSKRKTLPIVMGHSNARIVMSIVSVIAGLILYHLMNRFNTKPIARGVNIAILCWHFLLAARLVLTRSRSADSITYKYHLSFMYCAVVLSSFLFLSGSDN